MNMSKNKTNRFMPFIMAFCVVIGIIIGTFFSNHFSGNRLNVINSGSNRLNNLLHLIDDQYVDPVNIDSLVDKAIPQILAELDPHSVYISAKDAGSGHRRSERFVLGCRRRVCHPPRYDTYTECDTEWSCRESRTLAGDKIVAVDGKPLLARL